MSLTYQTLDADGVREAAAQIHGFWGQGRALDQHTRRIFDALDRMGDAMRYVGLRDAGGALVASLRFLTVALQTPRGVARTLGIAAVFVPEAHRGRGYGQAVVRAAMEEARALGYDAALLYSDIAPEFYARLGYTAFPALDWSAEVASLPADAPLATRRAAVEDVERLRGWYHEAGATVEIFPFRTRPLWDFFRGWRGTENDLILSKQDRDLGYVSVRAEPEGMRLFEWAAPGVAPEHLWATVRALATEAARSRVYGWLRPDRRAEWMTVTPRDGAIPMIAWLKDALPITADTPAFFEEPDHF